MGDINQRIYLETYLPTVTGPVLEIGSKDYGNTTSFRSYFSKSEYIGVDKTSGKNVDYQIDLCEKTEPLKTNYFDLAICCSVLEHVSQPWKMAHNISSLLRKEGLIYISVPWVWRYHAYPDDYFRFSVNGVKSLFDNFAWLSAHYSTTVEQQFIEITEKFSEQENKMTFINRDKNPERQNLPFLMINMIGRKK